MKQSALMWIIVPVLVVAALPSVARAEHAGFSPNSGRAVIDPVSGQALMNNLVSSCVQARLNGGNFNVFNGANVASQGVLPDSSGGLLQIGVPPGTAGTAGATATNPPAGTAGTSATTSPNGQIFNAKCTGCHGVTPAQAAIARINSGDPSRVMPPPPGSAKNPRGVTINADEKAKILTFLQTGT